MYLPPEDEKGNESRTQWTACTALCPLVSKSLFPHFSLRVPGRGSQRPGFSRSALLANSPVMLMPGSRNNPGIQGLAHSQKPTPNRRRAWERQSHCPGKRGRRFGKQLASVCHEVTSLLPVRPPWHPRFSLTSCFPMPRTLASLLDGKLHEGRARVPRA